MKKLLNGIEVEMTELEIQQLEKSRITTWSKEAHLAEINALHKSEFDRKWLDLEYDGRWEVVDAARDASNEYHEEAKALMSYWWNGWAAIKAYSETVAENNFIEPLDFVNAL